MAGTSHQTLYLLDGMALVYRAHFVFIAKPIRNSAGVNTSASYGFTNTLVDILTNQKPTHMAVAFDTAAPTERHEAYAPYKAQREEMPEELSAALPVVKDIIRAFRIPVLELDGYEADDIIGTLARRAERENITTYMVTPDKDFGQLVTDRILIHKPGRQGGEAEILGPEEIRQRWGIDHPGQVIDILGLMGDASDNIPGVPGIGEKTAAKLIAQFGSIESLYQRLDEVKGKQKEKLAEHKDQAFLSRKLAVINTAVPLDIEPSGLLVGQPDQPALKKLFADLEFNSLGKRVLGSDFHAGRGAVSGEFQLEAEDSQSSRRGKKKSQEPPATPEDEASAPPCDGIHNTPHQYRHLATDDEIRSLVDQLRQQPAFCFDTETDGLNPRESRPVGLSFSWKAGEAVFVRLHDDPARAAEQFRFLAPAFERDTPLLLVGHNLKFDLAVLHAQGIRSGSAVLFDTMIAHALVEPEQRHGMDYLSEVYLGYRPVPITALIGEKGADQIPISCADPALLADYAAEDADVTWRLHEKLKPLLAEKQQQDVFYKVEMPLIPALVAMEAEGIAIDLFALEEFSAQLGAEIEKATAEIHVLAGHEFNLNSPKQLGVVLFEELKLIEKPSKTKTGQYKTDEQTLAALAPHHRIVARLLDHRAAVKLKGTYVDALPNAVSPRSGRVHTTFQQAATTTGRLASSDPNLQNIPIRTELGREIRKAFVPRDKDHLILSADYSQIELRILAALSGDEGLLAAFRDGLDIHAATAARIYGVPLDGVESEMRRKAKMVNFGIAYGISPFGLAQRLGIPRAEAAEIIDHYFQQFPGIRSYIDQTLAFGREHGYVETLTGRRRHLPDLNSANQTVRSAAERNAINMPVQGAAADLIKLAMSRIHHELVSGGYRTRMLLQVHDELVFDLHKSEEQQVRDLVTAAMVHALPELEKSVPIEVETGVGPDWLSAH